MPISNEVRWHPMLDEAPCETCPHTHLCKTGDTCPAFTVFVQFGGRRWRQEARMPDTENETVGLAQRR
jgi:hypothetical protein